MQTILGPFQPYLEDVLVEKVLQHKEADLLSPLLILVPSDLLRRRLKILLSRERRLSLLNVQLLTFYQLALKLQAESGGPPLELHGDLFLEETLRQIIRTRRPGTEPFAGIEDRAGGCAALWQTVRDLRDGLVDPALALEALDEGHFSQRASERTSELLLLLQTFMKFCQENNVRDQSDLDRSATEQVLSSRFLKQFAQVFYYGFYDLTQIQVDFFHAVARHYPTTLFFPLLRAKPSHDAWRFAERFYERYIQGHNETAPAHEPAAEAPLPASARLFDDAKERKYSEFPRLWRCQIANAFGIHDEVATAAKEILKLVDDGKLQFHEIGVVARSFDSYGLVVKDLFQKHRIPLAGAIEQPLAEFPLTKAVILLLNLPAKDFLRSQVIDLLASPYFQLQNVAGHRAPPRPDLWDLATRELAICRGVAEWRRLRRFTGRDLVLPQTSDDDEPREIRIPAAQLASLAEIVEALVADLSQLPSEASWQNYATTWKVLLGKYLGIMAGADMSAGQPTAPKDEILTVLDQLAGLDATKIRVTLGDFSHTFQHWLERTKVTEDRRNRDGVMVVNATAARGLSFRALFILGMNEGVFPRTIREDAFLRDRDREVLERDLGYKVGQKLTAFDEEKLLFTLLVGAARERLYCSFQRSDDSGRALAPSWYINELEHTLGANARQSDPVSIPRSIVEKATTPPFDRQEFLLPTELAVRLTLAAEDPTALIEASAPLPALYKQGRKIVAELDRSAERLHGYDGVVGKLDSYWTHFSRRGVAPTALETYARCPFQFFARHVLGLQPLERPEEILGPSPAEYGELGHEILKTFYGVLIENGYFTIKASTTDVETTLQTVATRAFADYAANNPVGYPLTWESLKEGLLELLRQVVAQDLGELESSGFAPVSLETAVTSQFPADWPAALKNLAIRGRMDRIDRNDTRLRVIDYKFKLGASPLSQDKNLIRAALRGERLQPPFYYLLAERWAEQQSSIYARRLIEADFYYIAPRWPGGPLVPTPYGGEGLADEVGAATKQTIAYLADGIRQGRFFINRGEYCGLCDVAPICHKNHPPSLWRAENDPLTKPHQELREKDPKKL
jgi:ATP-dependent helicase/nuclease subunit B